MADTPTSPCMVAHHETEKNRFYYVNYGAILFNKIALSENVQMGISTDNLGMGLSAILKGVYQVRAIGSGTTPPPSVFTHTVPASMTIGQSYQISFSGVTSTQGSVTYTISSPVALGSMGSFSKGTGILAGENITFTVHADSGNGAHDVAVPGNYSFEVRAYAGQTLVSSHTVNFAFVAASVPAAVSEVFGIVNIVGSSTPRQIVSGQNLRDYGGMVHTKIRSESQDHYVFHTARGVEKTLHTNAVSQEYPIASSVTAFNSDGFSLGIAAATNAVGKNLVGWVWRNAPRFYQHKVVLKTGGSDLRVAFPELGTNIAKARIKRLEAASNWYTWFEAINDTGKLLLNDTMDAPGAYGVMTVSNNEVTLLGNYIPEGTWLVEVWASDNLPDGIIKCGKYTVPSSGVQDIELGWRPQYIEFRRIEGDDWAIFDTTRGWTFSTATDDALLRTNEDVGEIFANWGYPTSTGFRHSGWANGDFLFTAVREDTTVSPPVLTGTINHSSFVTAANAGATGSLTLSGVTSSIGTPTYSISEQGTSYFTFSKTSGIAANENVTWSLAAGAPTGTVTFSISANTSPSASNGPMTVTHTFQVTAAAPKVPVLTGTIAVSGAGGTTTAGSSATFRFSGVTADTGTVTYSIANSGQSYFTFSKSTNIAANEAITVTAATNTPTGSYNFTISANTSPSASNGPVTGSCSQSVTAAVVTPTLSGTISHNIPSTATAANNYNVHFSGKSATSGQVLYSVNVNSGSQYVSFSKTSGITAGETVIMSVASNAPNGGSISGTISANTSPVGASNGPDSVGFSLGTLAIVEPDPSFSGFSHSVPTNTQQGQSYTVTFSGTSSSNGRQVWYSLSPQSGLSFSKLDNISPGEAVTMTVSGSASGTLGVSVYANTTKNSGSTFTQSLAYIQTAVAVPVVFDSSHLTVSLSMVTPSPLGSENLYQSTLAVKVSGATISDNRQILVSLTNAGSINLGQTSKVPQGTAINFVATHTNGIYPPYTLMFTDSAGNELGFERLSEQLGIGPIFGNLSVTQLPLNVSH